MKILGLGCSGNMGRYFVETILESPIISSITVADYNFEIANAFVELVQQKLKEPGKLHARKIDVTEHEKLIELMQNYDLIVNCVGPFYKFGVPILKAAIEAKRNYLDICDDWKPTLDMLELNEKAKNAKIIAIIGIGASPGITNLMAVLASRELDEIDTLITGWGIGQGKTGKAPKYHIEQSRIMKKIGNYEPKPDAATIHLLYESIEKIPIYRDGKLIKIEPLTIPDVDPYIFPGYDPAYVVYIGHPENVTLHRTIKTRNNYNVMYLGKTATEITKKYSDRIRREGLKIKQAASELNNDFAKLNSKPSIIMEYVKLPPGLSAMAIGTKNGIKKKSAVGLIRDPYGRMAGVTSVPLSIATEMMIEGKFRKFGVFTPEDSIDPEDFFNKLLPYCGENLSLDDMLLKKIERL